MTPIRLLIVDDHPITVEGVLTLLNLEPEFVVVGVATNGREALSLSAKCRPDLCLIDLLLPDIDGVDLALELRRQHAGVRLLIFSAAMHSGHVARVIDAQLDGYVYKSSASTELLDALHAAVRGSRHLPREWKLVSAAEKAGECLTRRELQILRLIVYGRENPEIASELKIDLGTVKNHVHHILGKLGARQRTHAAAIAISRGLVRPPES